MSRPQTERPQTERPKIDLNEISVEQAVQTVNEQLGIEGSEFALQAGNFQDAPGPDFDLASKFYLSCASLLSRQFPTASFDSKPLTQRYLLRLLCLGDENISKSLTNQDFVTDGSFKRSPEEAIGIRNLATQRAEELLANNPLIQRLKEGYRQQRINKNQEITNLVLSFSNSEEVNPELDEKVKQYLEGSFDQISKHQRYSEFSPRTNEREMALNCEKPEITKQEVILFQMKTLEQNLGKEAVKESAYYQSLNQRALENELEERSKQTRESVDEVVEKYRQERKSITPKNKGFGLSKLFGKGSNEKKEDRFSENTNLAEELKRMSLAISERGSLNNNPQDSVREKLEKFFTPNFELEYKVSNESKLDAAQEDEKNEMQKKNDGDEQQNQTPNRRVSAAYLEKLENKNRAKSDTESSESAKDAKNLTRRGSVKELIAVFDNKGGSR